MPTDEQQDQRTHDGEARVAVLLEISNAMVRVFKSKFGRGPTSARAYWMGRDGVAAVLENTLTSAERSLAELGEHQRLRDMRLLLQYSTMRDLVTPVEAATGRKVRAFTSGTDTKVEGLSVETFMLHPPGFEGPSRLELDD